jgi:hypothetical protein
MLRVRNCDGQNEGIHAFLLVHSLASVGQALLVNGACTCARVASGAWTECTRASLYGARAITSPKLHH